MGERLRQESTGVDEFTELKDTVSNYSGLGGQFVKVKATEDGLETAALAGGGDMAAATYDPSSVSADCFDCDNHNDGSTNGVYTLVERTKLSGIASSADVTADNAPKAHSASHTDGTDDIRTASTAQSGIASSTQIAKLDATASSTDLANHASATSGVHSLGTIAQAGSADYINVSLYNAKGAILVASAASTAAAVAVAGTTGYVLSADSAEATGVKWIALAGGGDMQASTYDPASKASQVLVEADVDDTPVNAASTVPISSNWAYDHAALSTGVHGASTAEILATTADITATKLDDFTATDDNTDLDASSTKHGLYPKADFIKLSGVATGADVTGDNAPKAHAASHTDGTDDIRTASTSQSGVASSTHIAKLTGIEAGADVTGSHAPQAHASTTHISGGADALKLDDLAATDDNTDLDASSAKHGLYPKADFIKLATIAASSDVTGTNTLPQNWLIGEKLILLDPALSADSTYSGIAETGTAGSALAFGQVCYLSAASSRWHLAVATATATAGAVKIGMCAASAAAGSTTTMLLWGKIRADSVFPTFTVSAPVFISTTAGTVTNTASSGTTNYVVRIIGHGNTGDELFFNPDPTYLEMA